MDSKKNYTCWNKHGEDGSNEEEVEDTNEHNMSTSEQDVADILGLSADEVMYRVENLEEMVHDVERHDNAYSDGELARYKKLIEDSKKLIYPNCDIRHTRLNTILRFLQLKANNGWSDNSFKALLDLLRDILPQGNLVPRTVYEAKQVICPLGLEVEKIHACKNDCILYRGEDYGDLDKCPNCGLDRFKRKKAGGDDDEIGSNRKGCPKKVFWYFPIIPRLQRSFANRKESQLLRWHKEGHKEKEGLIRHPADSIQWHNIDSKNEDFAADPRNIRLCLSTDGMNPFMNNSTHSTWPIVLTIFNLPPWLCNKRKYIMLSGLIPGPDQPGNNIDTYLRPLMEDLERLWTKGVEVWDEYKREYFNLRAVLFCTVTDSPAGRNLSGQSKRLCAGCPHCLDETDSRYVSI